MKEMTKPGLGKGLGKLMSGDKVAGTDDLPTTAEIVRPAFGRGVNTLMQGSPEAADPPAQKPLLPAWFYYGADLLLLFLSVAVAFSSEKPLSTGPIIFCAICILIGIILALLGLARQTKKM